MKKIRQPNILFDNGKQRRTQCQANLYLTFANPTKYPKLTGFMLRRFNSENSNSGCGYSLHTENTIPILNTFCILNVGELG